MLSVTTGEFFQCALSFNGRTVIEHSAGFVFASAIKREKRYETNRGTVKETIVETERIPLTVRKVEGDTLTFSSDGTMFPKGHSLTVQITELTHGVKLSLTGEPGWSYQFRLPAIEHEAVFGGGEQYRQTNLRGETVVNFVSEHIKAKTILEKALLPRALYKEKPHSSIGSYAPMPIFVSPTAADSFGSTPHPTANPRSATIAIPLRSTRARSR